MNATAQDLVTRHHGYRGNQRFEPLPPPTGAYPYRLRLEDVLAPAEVDALSRAGRLVFHVAGDTGGAGSPAAQQIVALHMESALAADGPAPSFLYLLGDVVSYHGHRSDYYAQFYEPYARYAAPIFAVPGDRDGDPLEARGEPSLTAFADNFCAPRPHLLPEAGDVRRDAMTQPNVYWTLMTPFVTVVGLYSNVPEGGRLDEDQLGWLVGELAAAPRDVSLVVACHHPPYSADARHGGSAYVGETLDAAFAAAGRVPDAVLSAHVHNYQRFDRSLAGRTVPYVVLGAGGYWRLDPIAADAPAPPWEVPELGVTLRRWCDDRHGFLRVTATRDGLTLEYVTVPRPHESWRDGPVAVIDAFEVGRAG
jgi:Calcineurin-like phosphoesterase